MPEPSKAERRDDCGRVDGGRFGPKNQCQDDGNGGGPSRPASPGKGFPGSGWKSDSKAVIFGEGGQNKLDSVGKTAERMRALIFGSPKTTIDIATAMGIDSVDELLKIGAAGFSGAETEIDATYYDPDGGRKAVIDIFTTVPIEDVGEADLRVSLSMQNEEVWAELGNFEIDDATRKAIEKSGGDDSPIKRRIGAHVFSKTLESLATLEEKGITRVITHAAGDKSDDRYQGYRLWGRFGFDGPIDAESKAKLAMTDGVISKEQRTKIRQGGELNLQELIATPEGEDWWRENGRSIKLKLDLADKESTGYKRYTKMKDLATRVRKRKGERSYMSFMALASRSYVCKDLESRAFCPTGEGNGVRNDCSPDESSFKGPPDVVGEKGKSTKETFPPAWEKPDDLEHEGPIPGAPGLAKVVVRAPAQVRRLADQAGVKSVSQLLEIFASTSDGSRVEIQVSSHQGRTTVHADTTVRMKDVGDADVSTKIIFEDGEATMYYGYFQPEDEIKDQIKEGNRAIESAVTEEMYDKMIASMDAVSKTNIKTAKTNAAGSPTSTRFKGYKIWGRFGFDGRIPYAQQQQLVEHVKSNPTAFSPQLREKLSKSVLQNGGNVNLQELLETKDGERWWKEYGADLDLEFDFTDKESIGYKRFERLKATHERVKARGSKRSLVAFVDYLQRTSFDPLTWPGFTEVERRNCGIGPGGFQKGNTCATGAAIDTAAGAAKGGYLGAVFGAAETLGFAPAIAAGAAIGATFGAIKGLYNNQMQPTRVNKALKNLGLDDDKVVSIVKGLKGSPASVAKSSSKHSVDLEIKNRDGKKTFDVKIEKDKLTITPAKKISDKQATRIAEIAKNSGKNVQVAVNNAPPSAMATLARAGGKLAVDTTGTVLISFALPAYSLVLAPIDMVAGEAAAEVARKVMGA